MTLDASRNYQRITECLALLDRTITEEEQREAAKALGLESWLPEPKQESLGGV